MKRGRLRAIRTGGSSRIGGPRLRAAIVLFVGTASISTAACTFERRAEPEAEEASTPSVDSLDSGQPQTSSADAEVRARSTVERFREAVTVGDLSPALSLLAPEATLVDAEVGRAEEASSRGEFLLELRERHMEGMHFEPVETQVSLPGGANGGTAFVFTLLAMLEEGEGGIGEEAGRVFESVLLVDSDGEWRIRHLHRSLAPEP